MTSFANAVGAPEGGLQAKGRVHLRCLYCTEVGRRRCAKYCRRRRPYCKAMVTLTMLDLQCAAGAARLAHVYASNVGRVAAG